MKDIHDIKPILEMETHWGWWPWILSVAAVAAVVWLWWRHRRTATAEPAPAPMAAPEEEARLALERLVADDPSDGRHFYFGLSALLRRYVERRFAIPAGEMTLEELLPHMDRLPLAQDLRESFKALCRRCETIKFAAAPVETEHMAQDLAFAKTFVHRTTARSVEEGVSRDGIP